MAGKKGEIPLHIKKKQKVFSHPSSEHPIILIFEKIEDRRKPSISFRYSLTSVLFMVLAATICGATDWAQIVVMCEGMKEWLSQYVDMSSGVPCDRTFKDIFNMINRESLEQALQEIAALMRQKTDQEIISFDGQTKRGTADKHLKLSGIHLLNAWSADNKICLGHLKVEDKSNEIPSMPKLMSTLDLKGTIITADAMNTQKTTVLQAIRQKADYVMPVKDNQPNLLEDIVLAFKGLDEEQIKGKQRWKAELEKAREHRDTKRLEKLLNQGAPTYGAVYWQEDPEKLNGRITTRSCTVVPIGNLPTKDDWAGLKSIARIIRERVEGNKVSREIIYYITSLLPNAQLVSDVVRNHWDIENGLHWRLDVLMRQDQSRYRDRIGASNLGVIYKIALNALIKEDTLKKGVATKRAAAALNPNYRTLVLKKLF
jgi:predicted transposase YbfD/YdcC